MLKIRGFVILALAVLVPAGYAHARASGGATEDRRTADSDPQGAAVSGSARADAGARVDADDALRHQIEARAARVHARDLQRAEADMAQVAIDVDADARGQGDLAVAGRLAAGLGMTREAILDEKKTLDTSWGNLVIAHAIAARSRTPVTVVSLVAMQRDAMGWGRIAAGLGLKLGSAVSAVKTEGKVATGRIPANGHAELMRGSGARAGAGAGADLHAGAAGSHAGAGVGTGLHVGGRIKP